MKGLLADQAEALNERCGTFARLHVWPESMILNWRGWLQNFAQSELRFARCLLEAFCYFGRSQTTALLHSAFHSISRDVVAAAAAPASGITEWEEFLARVVVTFVEGESPSPTDSGYAFARRARDVLGLPDSRIVFPPHALELVVGDPSLPIVFVDDIVGSGHQFSSTWSRPRPDVKGQSFATVDPANVWYVPLIATWKGVEHIKSTAPSLRLRPAHYLTERYSARSDTSVIWPDGSHADARAFVEATSERAGYGGDAAWGFHRLGLTVAIDDNVPDFSLPLYHSTKNGWTPLMRRAA